MEKMNSNSGRYITFWNVSDVVNLDLGGVACYHVWSRAVFDAALFIAEVGSLRASPDYVAVMSCIISELNQAMMNNSALEAFLSQLIV
ncbi:hypothetical protein Tco_0995250 [Tanacetum coccineum]